MAIELDVRPDPEIDSASDPVHVVCCNEARALCGMDMTRATWTTDPASCVVCVDLEDGPCSEGCPL